MTLLQIVRVSTVEGRVYQINTLLLPLTQHQLMYLVSQADAGSQFASKEDEGNAKQGGRSTPTSSHSQRSHVKATDFFELPKERCTFLTISKLVGVLTLSIVPLVPNQ